MSAAADTFDAPGGPELGAPAQLSAVYILRDRERLFERIRRGEDLRGLILQGLLTAVVGSMIFGLALGIYAQSFSQILASGLKLPILLLGAAALCFPAFHLLQSGRAVHPLGLEASVALQSTALAAVALVWGSLAPAVIFLVTSTQHYRLCQFLAVGVGAAGGVVGLGTLLAGYRSLCQGQPQGMESNESEPTKAAPRRSVWKILNSDPPLWAYFFLFGCVGGQLSWVLRPFIGSPTMPFQIFRTPDPEAGNFFLFLLRMLGLG